MRSGLKFYRCNKCGNLIGMVHNSGVAVYCCGEAMEGLIPSSTDASREKHLPVITVSQNLVTVTVGEVLHPMMAEHYIQWIYLQTDKGDQRRCLAPGDRPCATFALMNGESVIAAYAYCNLHGLWFR